MLPFFLIRFRGFVYTPEGMYSARIQSTYCINSFSALARLGTEASQPRRGAERDAVKHDNAGVFHVVLLFGRVACVACAQLSGRQTVICDAAAFFMDSRPVANGAWIRHWGTGRAGGMSGECFCGDATTKARC
jgi:hypothetical protein